MEGSDGVTQGDGWAVALDADALGEGYGFRKVRQVVGVTEFGINLITIPGGFESGFHAHERQQELYFVHRGAVEMEFGDGGKAVIREGGAARVDASAPRKIRNLSDSEDAQYLVIGGEGGYVGRDGVVPEGETNPRGPGL